MRPNHLVLLLLTAVAAPVAAQTATAVPSIPALRQLTDSTAREGAGARVVVTGPVVQVRSHTHDGTGYLNFGGRFPAHTFSVIIPDSAMTKFGDLTRFEGHRARATGTVWMQDGQWPAMTISDPAALELLP